MTYAANARAVSVARGRWGGVGCCSTHTHTLFSQIIKFLKVGSFGLNYSETETEQSERYPYLETTICKIQDYISLKSTQPRSHGCV